MVLTGELEVISGISIEEEDEDADDGFRLPGSVSVPTHQHLHHVSPPQHVVGPYDSINVILHCDKYTGMLRRTSKSLMDCTRTACINMKFFVYKSGAFADLLAEWEETP